MSLLTKKINNPIDVKDVETTPNSRLIKAAMLEVYIQGKPHGMDAYTAKISILRYVRKTQSKPIELSTATDELLKNAHVTADDLDIAMNELQQNDHFLFDIMARLMTPPNQDTRALDTYDARKEVLRLIDEHGDHPEYLANEPAYLETLKGFKTRNFTMLEIDHAMHSQRLAVVEVLTHQYEWDAQRAFDIVTVSTGTEMSDFLIESKAKGEGDKNEVVEKNHDHHEIPKVPVTTVTSSTAGNPVLANDMTTLTGIFQASSSTGPVLQIKDTIKKHGYEDKMPTYVFFMLIGLAGVYALKYPVTSLLQKMGLMSYNGYQTPARANQQSRLQVETQSGRETDLDLESEGLVSRTPSPL